MAKAKLAYIELMSQKYGKDFISGNLELMNLKLASMLGDEAFKKVIGLMYDNSKDYWRIEKGKLKIEKGDSLIKIAKEIFGINGYQNGQFTEEFKAFVKAIGFEGTNYSDIAIGQEFNLEGGAFKSFVRKFFNHDQQVLEKYFDKKFGTNTRYNAVELLMKNIYDTITGQPKNMSYVGEDGKRYVKINGVEHEIPMSSRVVYQLDVEGKGYKTYNPNGEGNNPYLWGEKALIKMIKDISKEWHKKFPNNTIFVGDINQVGGGETPGHFGYHADGLNFDIKFISVDGKYQQGNFFSGINTDGSYNLHSNYDQMKTKMLVNMFLNYDSRNFIQKMFNIGKSDISIKYILFNDPEIKNLDTDLIWFHPDHDNHLDLRYLLNF